MRLFLTLIIFVVRVTGFSDSGCMYGWKLDDNGKFCFLNCGNANGGSSWNVYCKSAPLQDSTVIYNSTQNALFMPVGRSLFTSNSSFPFCHILKLLPGHYNQTLSGVLRVGNRSFPDVYATINRTSLCFMLSPQLLQCEMEKSYIGDYRMEDEGATIVIPRKNIVAYLGDFYIDDNGTVFTCSKGVDVSLFQAPRCNYVTMNADDYFMYENGSVYIPSANFIIKLPIYSIVTGDLTQICFPLTVAFLNCRNKMLNFAGSYIFNRDMSATIFDYYTVSKPNEYYLNSIGQLIQCDNNDIESTKTIPKIIYEFYMAIALLSDILLVFTIILRYNLFMLNDHTRCMLNHIVCLILSNISLAANDFYAVRGGWPSYLLFALYYFFSLTASLWLNVIAFDLWRFFTRLHIQPSKRLSGGGSCSRGWKTIAQTFRLTMYHIYCWGVALLLTGLVLGIDLCPLLCQITFGLCPHINHYGWFNNVDSLLLYFYLPFNVLTVSNCIFMVLIVRGVMKASLGTDMVNQRRRQQLFRVSVRLFSLTGFCYVTVLVCSVIIGIDNSLSMYTWYPMTATRQTVPFNTCVTCAIRTFANLKACQSIFNHCTEQPIDMYRLIIVLMLVDQSYMDIGCMQGWRLSECGEYCTVNCADPEKIDRWNVYCETAPAHLGIATYHSVNNSFTMPVGESLLASQQNRCFNVSIQSAQSIRGYLNVSGYYLPSTSNFNNDTLCYPLSPQLLNCKIERTNYGDYYLENNASLIIASKNFTAQLGDFEIDGNKSAITCSQQIKDTQFESPRCNYIIMYSYQYTVNEDGSLIIHQTNLIINIPINSIVIGYLTFICVPLALTYLSCPLKKIFEPRSYVFSRHMEVINYELFVATKPDLYFVSDAMQVTQCVTNNWDLYEKVEEFIFSFLFAVGILSNICLLLTLLMQCRMFTQKDTHTHCMFNHIVSMAMSNLIFSTHRFIATDTIASAYIIFFFDYYFTVAASLWLNALAFDSWRYFSRLSAPRRLQRTWSGKNLRRYLFYNLYCWGIALLLTLGTIIVDFIPGMCDATFGLCPHIRQFSWFNNVDAFLLYFCLPFNVLTLCNLIFLILIARTVHLASIGTELVNNRRKKQIFIITVKLYVLTGFYYTIILACNITIAIENLFMMRTWFISSGLFVAQGIAIFSIYFSKKDTVDVMKNIISRSRNSGT
ncbi:hypothetical protein CHUAL_011827 [Chamberlinius hualienensis]